MKAAMDAVGLDGSRLQVVLIQLVRLMRDGEVVRMSKRSGKAIQLADLLDEVPVDAARFFFNLREANSRMDFDLDLAVEQSASNPVYYVQYAHARICSCSGTWRPRALSRGTAPGKSWRSWPRRRRRSSSAIWRRIPGRSSPPPEITIPPA